jgi:hypothetical protein
MKTIRLLKKSNVLILCLLSVLHSPVAQADPPQAVTNYYQNAKSALNALAGSVPSDRSFKVAVGEVRWQPIDSFRGTSPAWLVQFVVTTEKRLSYYHAAIIGNDGSLLMLAPGGSAWFKQELDLQSDFEIVPYSEVLFVRIENGKSILACATEPNGKYAPGKINLYAVEPATRQLLLDTGCVTSQPAETLFWESMYYFKDVNGDGRKDILINRRVHEIQGTTITKKNQKFVFTLTPTLQPVESTGSFSSTLVPLFEQAKSDATVPKIEQGGLPYQDATNLGEAIFPEDQNDFGITYVTVRPPDLGVVPSMLPTIFAE